MIPVICPDCGGTGAPKVRPAACPNICPRCGGSGEIVPPPPPPPERIPGNMGRSAAVTYTDLTPPKLPEPEAEPEGLIKVEPDPGSAPPQP